MQMSQLRGKSFCQEDDAVLKKQMKIEIPIMGQQEALCYLFKESALKRKDVTHSAA